jgi:hypothetical protein
MNTPTLTVPHVQLDKLSTTAEKLGKATVEAGKATAERITHKAAKQKKHRRTRFLLTRLPLVAGIGLAVRWITDPVSGAERRQRLMSLVGRGHDDQVTGEGSMEFVNRTADPAVPAQPPMME